jgi:malate permease and related proteins
VEHTMSGGQLALLLLYGCLTFILLLILGLAVIKLLRVNKAQAGVYKFMAVFGNVVFMGFPMVATIFGSGAVFYASIFVNPIGIMMFSLGIVLTSGGEEKPKIDYKLFVNAPLVSSLIALVIYLLSIRFPTAVTDSLDLLGAMTAPGAMLVIGSSLADIPLREVFDNWRVYVVSLTKLLVGPVLVWLVLKNLISDPMVLGIAVITAAMPIATTATMLSLEYGGDYALASKGVFISTALSLLTIPLTAYLLLV